MTIAALRAAEQRVRDLRTARDAIRVTRRDACVWEIAADRELHAALDDLEELRRVPIGAR